MALIDYVAGSSFAFDPITDVLQFSATSVSASALQFQQSGTNLQVGLAGQFITLLNTSFAALNSTHLPPLDDQMSCSDHPYLFFWERQKLIGMSSARFWQRFTKLQG